MSCQLLFNWSYRSTILFGNDVVTETDTALRLKASNGFNVCADLLKVLSGITTEDRSLFEISDVNRDGGQMMRKTSLKNTAYAGEVNPCQSLGVLTRNLLNCFGLGVDLSNAEVLVLKPREETGQDGTCERVLER